MAAAAPSCERDVNRSQKSVVDRLRASGSWPWVWRVTAQPRTRAVAPHGLRILPSTRCATLPVHLRPHKPSQPRAPLVAPRRTGPAPCLSLIATRSVQQAHPPTVPSAGRDGRASSRWRGALPPRRARPRAADPYGCLSARRPSARRPSARRPSALPTAEPIARVVQKRWCVCLMAGKARLGSALRGGVCVHAHARAW